MSVLGEITKPVVKSVTRKITGIVGGDSASPSTVSVEMIEMTVNATSYTVNLTKGQDYTKCVPFGSWRQGTSGSLNFTDRQGLDIYFIDNAGTPAVKIDRASGAGDSVLLTLYVLELSSDFDVQQLAWGPPSAANFTVACSAVDTDHAFILAYAKRTNTGSYGDLDSNAASVVFNSSTEIQFSRGAGDATANQLTGHVFVVEDTTATHFRVQVATATRTTTGTTNVTLPSAVDVSHSFILGSFWTNETGFVLNDAHWRVDLSSTTNVRFVVAGDSGDSRNMVAQVVEWIDGSVNVQHISSDVSHDTTANVETANVPITAVDDQATVVFGTMSTFCSLNAMISTTPSPPGQYPAFARLRLASGGGSVNIEHFTWTTAMATTFRGWVAEFDT
jgi:hypothetical protein